MLPKIDPQLALAATSVILLGILIQYSLDPTNITQHLTFLLFGVVAFFSIQLINTEILLAYTWPVYIINLFLLGLTLLLGVSSRGSTRWLDFGFFQLQPSELTKIISIIFFARFIHLNPLHNLQNIIKIFLLSSIPIFLVFKQPDLGSSIILFLIIASIAYASGIRYKFLIPLLVLIVVLAPVGWSRLRPYQQQRITTFLNPTSDPLGKGYNTIQAIISVGSGQVFGRGLGHGTQTTLKFLPEYRTDFVFAAFAEELGFFGSIILIACFVWLLFYLISNSHQTKSHSFNLILVGIFAMLASEIAINVGMNIGLLPITGITLPLISSGGSSIVVTLLSLGIANQIITNSRKNSYTKKLMPS